MKEESIEYIRRLIVFYRHTKGFIRRENGCYCCRTNINTMCVYMSTTTTLQCRVNGQQQQQQRTVVGFVERRFSTKCHGRAQSNLVNVVVCGITFLFHIVASSSLFQDNK